MTTTSATTSAQPTGAAGCLRLATVPPLVAALLLTTIRHIRKARR